MQKRDVLKMLKRRKDWLYDTIKIKNNEHKICEYEKAEHGALLYAINLIERTKEMKND